MVDLIVFPSSIFNIAKVDEDLRQEYNAVLSTGLFDVALFGYDKWFNEDKLVIKNAPKEERFAIYQGWMMKPEQYDRFYNALMENNIMLVTKPEHYRLMHLFPNVYEAVKEDTAKMKRYPLHKQIDVEQLKKSFQKFMVKDYVKSVKGTLFPQFFDQEINQEDFDRWMEVFYQYRGKLLTGGICIKELLNLKYYGVHTNEYRVFYINHEAATVSRNSGQGNYTPQPPQDLIKKYKNLDSPYYTIDFAELDNGAWKIIEAGDGEVSGLSENQNYEQYFRTLYQCFKQ
ncbi:MAG: ATP-grasp domain-containing protein [Lachnospiraceae bacterium]|nr:ATP-grasp domain-containing protein [Lachnospiraceae bacterium]